MQTQRKSTPIHGGTMPRQMLPHLVTGALSEPLAQADLDLMHELVAARDPLARASALLRPEPAWVPGAAGTPPERREAWARGAGRATSPVP